MASDLREDIVNSALILRVLQEKYGGKYQFLSYKAKVATEKGDNFIGDLIDVEVTVRECKEEKTLHWMCKVMKKGKASAVMDKMNIFVREEAFYTTYLKDLDKYVKPNLLRTVPLIYSINEPDNQILILEHLGYSGYRDPTNKKKGLDSHHVKGVLKWLAEMHGAGFLLLKKYPGGYESWVKDNELLKDCITVQMLDNMTDEYMRTFLGSLEVLKDGSENDGLVEAFIPLVEDFFHNYASSFTQKAKELLYDMRLPQFKTLIHGDPWFNNMLFKYENGEKLLDVILLDMQIVFLGNIGSDLSYFLLSSVNYENLSANLDSYLEHYRSSLVSFVGEVDPGLEVPLSVEDIKLDFFKSLMVGFFFAIGAFPMTLVEKDEMPKVDINDYDWGNPEDIQRYGNDSTENMRKVMKSNPLVYGRLMGVIRFMMDVDFAKYCKY